MTQSLAAASQSWLGTSDAVLRGLNHEFSNRLSLARLAPQVAAMSAAGDRELKALMAETNPTEDLLNLLRLYRLMIFGGAEPPEPVLVSDTVADAVSLFTHHVAFRDVKVNVVEDSTIPPVLQDPVALTQAVLLLLSVAGRSFTAPIAIGAVITLSFTADADNVRITATPAAATAVVTLEPAAELPALLHLTRNADGAVELSNGAATLSIGTLVRLRRREKGG